MNDYNVLVVDDHLEEARTFADLIEARTKLRCFATSDPDDALRVCDESFITVAVLDENMPKAGTDLYAELKRISPGTLAIMLTQEEDADAAGAAIRLRYRDRLHKSRVEELPLLVLQCHTEALTALAQADSQEVLLKAPRKLLGDGRHVWLVSHELIDENYIDENDWRQLIEVNAGQEVRKAIGRHIRKRLAYDDQESIVVKLGIGSRAIPGMSAKLASALESRTSLSWSTEAADFSIVEESFKLQEPGVRTRRIEFAQVYARFRVVLRASCSKCGADRIVAASVRLPRDAVATRHVDYKNDDTVEFHPTGYRRLE